MKKLCFILLLLTGFSSAQAQINVYLKEASTDQIVNLRDVVRDDNGKAVPTFVITWSCKWCYPACYNVLQSFGNAAKSGVIKVVSVNIDGKDNWSDCKTSLGRYWKNVTDLYVDESLNSSFKSFFSTSNAPLIIYFDDAGHITYMQSSYSVRPWMFIDYFGEELIWQDSDNLNSYAWNYYTQNQDKGPISDTDAEMTKALRFSKRSMLLGKNYHNTDTYAALLYLSGHYTEALKAAKDAIDLAKANQQTYDSTSKLIEKIIEKM